MKTPTTKPTGFALSRKPKPPIAAADVAAAENRAQAEVVSAEPEPAAPVVAAPMTLALVAPSGRREAMRNTSLRLTDGQLDLLDRVFARAAGVKSKQDLLIKLLLPALERLDRELPPPISLVG